MTQEIGKRTAEFNIYIYIICVCVYIYIYKLHMKSVFYKRQNVGNKRELYF